MMRPPPRSTLFPYTTLFRSSSTASSSSMHRAAWGSPGLSRAARALPRTNGVAAPSNRSEEHTSELQSQSNLVCRLLLEKKNDLNPKTKSIPLHVHTHICAFV